MTLPKIGKAATNALANIGVTELKHVSKIDEDNLQKIHGVGPKAIKILKTALAEENLNFKVPEPLPFKTPFAVMGSLSCNNAPKREILRDFVIGVHTNQPTSIRHLHTDDCDFEFFTDVESISSLEINHLITHGKEGAASGVTSLKSGEKLSYAYIFEFENSKKEARIKKVSIYVQADC